MQARRERGPQCGSSSSERQAVRRKVATGEIERVSAKLEGKHWMFQGKANRLDAIKMCEDCRIIVATEEGFDPYGAPPRPAPRTTDDYLREREKKSDS